MRFQVTLLVSALVVAPAVAQPAPVSPVVALEQGLAICQSTFANRHPPTAEQVRASMKMGAREAVTEFPKTLGLVPPSTKLIEAAGWNTQGAGTFATARRDAEDAGISVHLVGNTCAVLVHAQAGKSIDNQLLLDAARVWIKEAYPEIDQHKPVRSGATRTVPGQASMEWQDDDGLSIRLSTLTNPVLDKDVGTQIRFAYKPQLPPPA